MRAPLAVWPASPDLPSLHAGDSVHLVGIGGAGMSGLARALKQAGLEVSGTDRQGGPVLDALAAEGLRVWAAHGADRIPSACRLVVYSPAVPWDHPELAAARERGLPLAKRAPILGALLDQRQGIAVAGTHGKSTTSALMAWVLASAGLQPSWFVGAEVPDLGSNARLGQGPHLVLEADEYDRSFLHGHPRLAVILNLEHDHPDIYPDLAAVREAFADFAARVPPEGWLLVNGASAEAWAATEGQAAERRAFLVEGDAAAPGCRPSWTASVLESGPEGSRFAVRIDGEDAGEWTIRLSGRHNVANALAVIAAADLLGVDRGHAASALAGFRGIGRRFELQYDQDGLALVDDYAHHPTELRATIAAARQRYPGRPVVAVVEPHTYSRVASLLPEFRAAMTEADRAIVLPIYAAREEPIPGIDAATLAQGLPGVEVAPDLVAGGRRALALAEELGGRAVLLFMGAGQVQAATRAALASLSRAPAGSGPQSTAAGRGGRSGAATTGLATDLAELLREGRLGGLQGDDLGSARLAEHCSIRVGGPAGLLLRLRQRADLLGWWTLAQAKGLPVTILGRGSNVLVRDGGLPGLVLLNRCEGWQLRATPEDPQAAWVEAESGVTLAALASSLAREGWAGLEAGVGIPGSVGAAVVTNAGAHGWEMADSLEAVELADREGRCSWSSPAALAMRYRGSMLKDRHDQVVLTVRLRLRRDEPAAIQARIEGYQRHRRTTQPRLPSVGSVFKNPPQDFAGRLIEAAGIKGRRRGDAEVSTQHANFIVNRGAARAAEVLALLADARAAVEARSGLRLETEIEVMGVDDAAQAS